MTIALIVIGSVLDYVFVAGVVFALLPEGFGSLDEDRSVCSWLWPVFIVCWLLWRIMTLVAAGIHAWPQWLSQRVEQRRADRRIPRAEVRK